MTYGHAVLGESLELCKDAADWFAAEKKRLETSKEVITEPLFKEVQGKSERNL